MATASSTSITVRVQAKGGKFLADDIGGSEVTIRDAQTGEWLDGGLALGTDSGNLSTLYSSNASLSAIVTPPDPPGGTPTVWWISPDTATSGLVAGLEISRPTLLEITAFGPLGGLQSAHRVTTTQVDRARPERGPGAGLRGRDPGAPGAGHGAGHAPGDPLDLPALYRALPGKRDHDVRLPDRHRPAPGSPPTSQ